MSEVRKTGIDVLGKIPGLLIFALVFISSGTVAQTAVDTQQTIRVVMDNNYPPYVFQSDKGKLQGILIDQWQAWEKKTGIRVAIHAMDWSEALQSMRNGEFDVIDCIVETADRQDYFDFTPAYNTIEASVYFRNNISGISDIASLKGFSIGVKTGDQHIDKFKASGVTNIILFHNNDAIIEAAKKHTINIFLVDNPSALYLLNKMGIESEFRHTAPIFRDELRRAVRKGDTAMLNIVSKGFDAIEPARLKQIDEKWFGLTVNRYERYLRYLTYAGYAVAAAILLIAGLVIWNRTLRKKILERTAALSQSEDRIRLIIDTIPTMAWSMRPDGTVDFLNQRWLDYTGLSLEKYIKDPTGPVHPEDIPRVMEKWLMNKAARKAFDDEIRLQRADGEYRWFLVRTAPLHDEQENLIKWYGVSIDIEDSKRAENALREREQQYLSLFENMAEGVAYFQMLFKDGKLQDAIYLEVNLAWENLTGLRNVVGRKITEVLPGILGTNSEFIERSVRVALTGQPERFEAYSNQLKKWLSTSAYCPKKEHVIVVFDDITERKLAEEAMKQSYEEIRRLTEHLQNVREEERTSIAREIHDELGQQLTAIKMDVAWIDKKTPEETTDIKRKLKNIIELLDGSNQSIRRILSELRPRILDDHGLMEAIEWLGRQFTETTGIPVKCTTPEKDIKVSEQIATCIFRVCQEAFTNITRYAFAKNVTVSIAIIEENIILIIEDDGIGFDVASVQNKKSFGILGMKERVFPLEGKFELVSLPGKGTKIIVSLPYQA